MIVKFNYVLQFVAQIVVLSTEGYQQYITFLA